jgi:probable rRNA maturation factor
MIRIAVQYALPRKGVPSAAALRRAARAALTASGPPKGGAASARPTGRAVKRRRSVELCLRVVGRAEARRMNLKYRGRDYATNVLSFPAGLGAQPPLGDVVICAPVVAAEARAQKKLAAAHWAHMVVHGTLHLLGHDHLRHADAARMERLERRVLAGLGHPDPYAMDDA